MNPNVVDMKRNSDKWRYIRNTAILVGALSAAVSSYVFIKGLHEGLVEAPKNYESAVQPTQEPKPIDDLTVLVVSASITMACVAITVDADSRIISV